MDSFERILTRVLQIGIAASAIVFAISILHPNRVLQIAGIAMLVATPLLRVAITSILFAANRNFTYTAITLCVLFLLLFQLLRSLG